MKKLLYALNILVLLSCNQQEDKYYMPAEWEKHDAVWLGWEADSTLGFYPVVTEMIKTLTPNVTVKIAFDSDSLMQTAKSYLKRQQIDTSNIKFYVMPGDRYWIRDNGAAFIINSKGQLGVADFGWNHYGFPQFLKEQYNNNQDSISKYLNKRLLSISKSGTVDSLMAIAESAKIFKTNVVTEGGNIEVNGKGTLIVCESAMKNRNPDLTKEFMESELKKVLGVSKVIWLKQGLAEDPNGFTEELQGIMLVVVFNIQMNLFDFLMLTPFC